MSREDIEKDSNDEELVEDRIEDLENPVDDTPETEEIVDETAVLLEENVELKEKILRMAAENQNTRKRLVKQQQDAHTYRNQDILRDLADVIDTEAVERGCPGCHVVRACQHGFLTNAARSKTSSWPVRCTEVERYSEDGYVEVGGFASSRQPHERRDATESWHVIAAERLWVVGHGMPVRSRRRVVQWQPTQLLCLQGCSAQPQWHRLPCIAASPA